MFTLASSSDCLLLVLAVLTVLVPICLSYRRNAVFLAKYAYLYSTYTLMSIVIIVLCLPRPKDPRNAVMGAKIMKPFNKMVRTGCLRFFTLLIPKNTRKYNTYILYTI